MKAVEKEVHLLEEDVNALEEMYPQGEKAETTWAMTVLGYLAKLILGVFGLIVSIAWIADIVIYLLIDPPLSPFLNEVFIKGWMTKFYFTRSSGNCSLCILLLLPSTCSNCRGNDAWFETRVYHHSSNEGNSFLFNVALILLCSISVIQFCSTAFAYYKYLVIRCNLFVESNTYTSITYSKSGSLL